MRRLYLLPIVIVALLAIVFVLAGNPLVLNYVKQKAETGIAEATGMPVTLGRLRGNLFYSVQLEEIDFADAVRIDRLDIIYNPLRLLRKELDIRSVTVSGLQVDLMQLQDMAAHLPEKTGGEATPAPSFTVKIRRFSIENSGLFGDVGSTPVEVSLATRGSMLHEFLMIDSLRLRTADSWVLAKGSVPLSEKHDLVLDYELEVSAHDLGIAELTGRISSQGSVGGTFSAIQLRASSDLAVRYQEYDLTGTVLLDWLLPDFSQLQLDARLNAMTESFQEGMRAKDTSLLHLSLRNKNLDCNIRSTLGNLLIRGDLRDDITEPYFRGRVEGDFDYLDFEPSFTGSVLYENGTLYLSDFNLVSRRVAMHMSGIFNTKKNEISNARVELSCSDLSVWNTFINAPDNMAGELWCSIDMWGSLDAPQARARLRVTDALIYGEKIIGVDFDLSLRDNVATLDSGRIFNERGEIMPAGQYGIKNGNFTASVRTEGLVFEPPETFGKATLPLGGTLGLNLMAQGNVQAPFVKGSIWVREFVYDTLSFGDYELELQLEDDSLRFAFASGAEDLILHAMIVLGGSFPCVADLELYHYELDQYITPATGFLTAHVSAKGALARIIDASGVIDIDTVRILVEGHSIENKGVISARLQDRMLHLKSCQLALADQSLFVNGTIPLDFTAGSMDITANSGQIQLGDIAYFLPREPAIRGFLRFDLRMQGKPRALDVDGMLSLTDASYTLENLAVDSVNGLLRFRNGLATIDRFAGKVNKGRFSIAGFADVSRGMLDTMLVELDVDRLDYSNRNFGDIVCSADLVAGARRDSLRISGEVIVDEAAYTAPMRLQTYLRLLTNANRPAPQQPEIARRIYCDIGIAVPDSIVIKNNIADLVVKADLQLRGYLARLNAYGTIAALDEGTIKYLGKTFTIVSAVIQFDDPYKIDPVIDLAATSTIAAADGDYEVYLLLDGTATTWQLQLSSNPPLPEQDIVSLILIGQRRPGAVGGMAKDLDLKGKVKDYALDMVRYNIEKTTEEMLGLDKFTLTGDLSDPTKMRIGIEKNIAKGFRLHYSTGLESWELYQIGASYDLTDRFSIFTLYDQENRNTSVDLEYKLKIK
jgi:autotransporter translocation and assembly factor TamB